MRLGKQGMAVALAVLGVFAMAEDSKYHPHRGPYAQDIAHVAHLQFNDSYVTLDPAETTRYMEEMQNPGISNAWFFSPAGDRKWFAILDYEETGHVKDNEKIDSAAVLQGIREGTAESNKARAAKGWPQLNIVGWRVEPHYESDTQRLSWATLAESQGQQVINYSTKILGRTGVVTVTLVTAPEELDASIKDLKRQLAGLTFDAGKGYAEFKDGDKIAEYGLTGLIVGGAAAVAAKTGFFKWIGAALAAGWKFIIIGLAACGAWIKSLFSRKTGND